MKTPEQIADEWKNTNIKSDIYSDITCFNDRVKRFDKERRINEIIKEIESGISKNSLDDALQFLVELELLCGVNDNIYQKYEKIISPLYQRVLVDHRRGNCKLSDDSIVNAQISATEFKNKHKGERCFIIGNGPSLNKLDLSKLKNEITFGVNSIFLNAEKMGFFPTYYTVEDSHVLSERSAEIKNIKSSMVFMPNYAYKIFGKRDNFVYINVILDYRRYKNFPHFSTDISRRAWVGGTVSYINIQLAYYMGFSEVYLVGFDHNYIIPTSANVKGMNIVSTEDDPNHFHPNYFGKGYSWHIPLTERMELCYIKAKYAFSLDNRSIFNATVGGKLEVFTRVDYSSLFKEHCKIKPEVLPTITVVIAAYNCQSTISAAIESVLQQQRVQSEILVVNDGSTDNTREIVSKYESEFKNVKVIHQDNQGLGGARNTGIKHCLSQYITFLDADDTLCADILYYGLRCNGESSHDIVMFDYARWVDGVNIKRKTPLLDTCGFDGLLSLFERGSLSAWCRIYKTDFLINNGLCFPVQRYHEDINFVLMSYYYAKSVTCIEKIGYNWISREGSITSRIRVKHVDDMFMNFVELKNFLINEDVYCKSLRAFLIFCYRVIDIQSARANEVSDIVERIIIIRRITRLIEDLDLNFKEYVKIVASFDSMLIKRVFLALGIDISQIVGEKQ